MKILFIGDSITDGGRDRSKKSGIDSLGKMYPKAIARKLTELYPDKEFEFMNRGVSGDRLPQVYARLEPDVVIEYPDIISILVGLNDCGFYNLWKLKLDMNRFRTLYINLIKEIHEFHPAGKFIIMEPFFYPAGSRADNSEHLAEAIIPVQETIKEVAEMYGIPYVRLQDKFTEKCRNSAPEQWLVDGIHTSSDGDELIADEWIKVFSEHYL